MNDGMVPCGGALSMEQRLARVEQIVIAKSIGTSKGALVGFAANGQPIEIPAAPGNGCGLTSVSSQPGGFEWLANPWDTVHTKVMRNSLAWMTAGTNFLLGNAAFTPVFIGVHGSITAAFYFDPAQYADGGLDVKVRLRVWAITETNPNDSVLTFALTRVTGLGASGTITTFASDIVSTTIAPNLATSTYEGITSEAAISTAGYYVVRLQHSVDPAQAMTYGYTMQVRVG